VRETTIAAARIAEKPGPGLGDLGVVRVPSALSMRLADRTHLDTHRAFLLARRQFVAGERIDMGNLAGQFGVDRTSLFRWVGNRDALLSELLWSLAVPSFNRVERETAGIGGARIAEILGTFAGTLIAADYFRAFLAREPARALRLLTTTDSSIQRRFVAVVEELVRRELGDRLPIGMQPHDLAYLLVRVSESFTYSDLITGETPSSERAGVTFAFVLRGM
jgi:hypothetical protein